MLGRSSHQIWELQAELHLLKVEKLDACIMPRSHEHADLVWFGSVR